MQGPVAKLLTLKPNEGDCTSCEDVGTSNNMKDPGLRIISKRERRTSDQHPVEWEGETVDNASWVSLSQLTTPNACEAFQSHDHADAGEEVFTSGNNSAYGSSDLENSAIEYVVKDKKDINREYTPDQASESLTDSQIARLLAKQEELGLGSSELMIFGDLNVDLLGRRETAQAPRHGCRINTAPHNRYISQNSMALQDIVETMSIADTCDEFDIMDFGRPSLQPKTSGRRDMPSAVFDGEFNRVIRNAWSKDRAKKKLRKEAREEARHQGLLGKRGNTSMISNHRNGITASQLKSDILSFLVSSHQR